MLISCVNMCSLLDFRFKSRKMPARLCACVADKWKWVCKTREGGSVPAILTNETTEWLQKHGKTERKKTSTAIYNYNNYTINTWAGDGDGMVPNWLLNYKCQSFLGVCVYKNPTNRVFFCWTGEHFFGRKLDKLTAPWPKINIHSMDAQKMWVFTAV